MIARRGIGRRPDRREPVIAAVEVGGHRNLKPPQRAPDAILAPRRRLLPKRIFARSVLARRQFFGAIRETVLSSAPAPALADSIRTAYRALEAMYPGARFPDVYFIVGRLQTGGTIGRPGLLVGAEHYAYTPGVPRGELSAWQQTAIFPPSGA